MKKAFLAGTLAVSSILAGCLGGPGGSTGNGGGSSEGSDGENIKISFVHWRGEDKAVFEELIGQFEKENPNVDVEMTIYPSEQYQSTAQTLLRDGSTGDVFTSFPGSQFEIINKAGLFEDLSGEDFVDNYNEKMITFGQADGKQLALPLQLVFNQPVYNATLFKELGLDPNPKSWDEFLALCQALVDAGHTPIAFPGADIGPGQFMNTMMMNNAPEEDIFEKLMAGEAKLTDEWWVKTLSQFKELNDKGYLNNGSLGTNHTGAISMVANGEAAMLATGSFAMAGIKEINPDLELGLIAPITVPEEQAEWEGIHTTTFMLAVNSKSTKKDAAKEFVSFLSEPEQAEKYANETSQHVTVSDVEYQSEELSSAAQWLEKNTRFQPRYLIPNADVEKAVIASIQSVIGGSDPKQAAEEAQQIVDQNIQ